MAETTRKLIVAMLLLAGAGCSTAPVTRSVSSVEPAAPAAPAATAAGPATGPGPAEDRSGSAGPRNPAMASLAATAARQREEGDPERAAATLERALRIDPDDAGLWLALAEVRMDQGLAGQAAGLARRAETLAPPGSETAARARALAARAAGR